MMKRREFITLLGGAAVAGPLAARGQQTTSPVIGFMSGRSPAESAGAVAAFRRGLAEGGYVEGKNVAIEYRWANGHYDRLPSLAAELAGRPVAVLAATGGSVSGLAAKAATTTIPIVFSSGGDAVKLGLVPSLNRPGDNVTGVNLVFGALGPKRLGLLHELIPNATTIAMLVNLDYPSGAAEVQDVQAAARTLGMDIGVFNTPREQDIEPAFAALVEQKPAGLLVADDPFLQAQRDRVVRLAAHHQLPAIYYVRDFVDVGGLMSYGPDIEDAYRLVGVYTARILKGEKPGDLPVLQPTKFDLVINLKTARTLGLDIPPMLLATADEVIE
jgi:putative ABC transport system substrate-binding protein